MRLIATIIAPLIGLLTALRVSGGRCLGLLILPLLLIGAALMLPLLWRALAVGALVIYLLLWRRRRQSRNHRP